MSSKSDYPDSLQEGKQTSWKTLAVVSQICFHHPLTFSLRTCKDPKTTNPEFPREVTEEGIKIVEELLLTWASRGPENDGEDIIMQDDLSPEEQLEELRRCVESFRPRIEKNQWLESVLAAL